MDHKYILVGKKVVTEPDLMKWAEWVETGDRRVAKTKIGDATVSTVFLAVDMNFDEKGEPLLFETMIFGGPMNNYMDRTSTWDDAEKAHQIAIDLVELAEKKVNSKKNK